MIKTNLDRARLLDSIQRNETAQKFFTKYETASTWKERGNIFLEVLKLPRSRFSFDTQNSRAFNKYEFLPKTTQEFRELGRSPNELETEQHISIVHSSIRNLLPIGIPLFDGLIALKKGFLSALINSANGYALYYENPDESNDLWKINSFMAARTAIFLDELLIHSPDETTSKTELQKWLPFQLQAYELTELRSLRKALEIHEQTNIDLGWIPIQFENSL